MSKTSIRTDGSSKNAGPSEHPSIMAVRARQPLASPDPLTSDAVRAIALRAGADDAAIVSIDHPDLAEEKPYILQAMPDARALVAIVLRMHPDNIRSPRRSVANLEFQRAGHEVDDVAGRIAIALSHLGYRAINPAMAFPMEMEDFPARSWIVSHKRVAVAAQLGRMGLHRSVIHPRFGSFILLGTVITNVEQGQQPASLDFNPCISCKLCVAACPVGAIEPSGAFRFSACYDHNYREFMTGFTDFIEEVVQSKGRHDFRERVPLPDAMSTWQSLAYKPSYKAAYCIAVCPAGEDVLGGYIDHQGDHLRGVVRPLTERREDVFVVANSDALAHVAKRFPHKKPRIVRSSLRPSNARAFFRALPLTFQRGPAKGWAANYHFDLSGPQSIKSTVRIDDGELIVHEGILGRPDIVVRGDSQVWIDIVTGRRNPIVAIMTRRLKVTGNRSLLKRFAACFPR